MASRSKRTEITADMVLKELARIGFSSARDVMAWGADGVTLRESADLTDDQAAIVSEVSQTISKEGGSIKLKVHDKISALKEIGKHLGIAEKHDHSGTIEVDHKISDTKLAIMLLDIWAAAEAEAKSGRSGPAGAALVLPAITNSTT